MLGVIGSNTSQLQKMLTPVLKAGCCKGIDSREGEKKAGLYYVKACKQKETCHLGAALLFENIQSLNEWTWL